MEILFTTEEGTNEKNIKTCELKFISSQSIFPTKSKEIIVKVKGGGSNSSKKES